MLSSGRGNKDLLNDISLFTARTWPSMNGRSASTSEYVLVLVSEYLGTS